MCQQGSICGHLHNVGIALQIGHKGGFVDAGSCMVPLAAVVVTGILSGKHLRSLAVVVVIAVHVVEEPLDGAVEMFVHEIGSQVGHRLPSVLKVLPVRARATGAHDFYLGIGRTNLFHKELQTVEVEPAPLLVAHSDILEVERFGMPHLGTHFTPLGIGRPVGKLDKVQAVLDIRVQSRRISGHVRPLLLPVLVLAGHAHIQHRQWLGTNLLAQLEQLVESHAIALEIVGETTLGEAVAPAVDVGGTVFHGSQRLLPVITGVERGTLHDTSAREAEHTGTHVVQGLYNVTAQTVPVALPRLHGEKAHMLHITHPRTRASVLVVQQHTQPCLAQGPGAPDYGFILFPFAALHLYPGLGKLLVFLHGRWVDQLHLQHLWLAFGNACPHAESVVLTLLHTDAEKALVLQTRQLFHMPRGTETHILGVTGKGAIIPHLQPAQGVPSHQGIGRILERAVLHHLGIHASVGSKIDILIEDAIHGGRYGCSLPCGLNGYHILLCCSHTDGSGHPQQHHQKRSFHKAAFSEITYILGVKLLKIGKTRK